MPRFGLQQLGDWHRDGWRIKINFIGHFQGARDGSVGMGAQKMRRGN